MMPHADAAIANVSQTAGIFKLLSSSFGAFPLHVSNQNYKTGIRRALNML
jgi:hypothetical protein